MVFESTLSQWGDFSEAAQFLKNIPNRGVSSKVRMNDRKDTAYIRIFPEVVDTFIIDTPQLVGEVKNIAFYKNPTNGSWEIFAFGTPIDPIIGQHR